MELWLWYVIICLVIWVLSLIAIKIMERQVTIAHLVVSLIMSSIPLVNLVVLAVDFLILIMLTIFGKESCSKHGLPNGFWF